MGYPNILLGEIARSCGLSVARSATQLPDKSEAADNRASGRKVCLDFSRLSSRFCATAIDFFASIFARSFQISALALRICISHCKGFFRVLGRGNQLGNKTYVSWNTNADPIQSTYYKSTIHYNIL